MQLQIVKNEKIWRKIFPFNFAPDNSNVESNQGKNPHPIPGPLSGAPSHLPLGGEEDGSTLIGKGNGLFLRNVSTLV
jgi:hypothetical protein